MALDQINNQEEFLITQKMKPILKGWLASSYEEAMVFLDEYEYKAEGLALSNIYFHHLALIQSYNNKSQIAKKTFEKYNRY